MRWPGLLAAVMLSACGGGGGGGVPSALELKVSFGVVRPDAPTRREVEVPNPLPALTTAEEVAGGAGAFALVAGELPKAVPTGAVLPLDFEFAPPGPGEHEAEFRVRFRSGDGQEREVTLVLVAYVETPRVALRAEAIDFGMVRIGESRTLRAYVENLSQATPVAVTSLGGLPAEFTAPFVPTTVLPREYHAIAITYAPEALGVREFEVAIGHAAGEALRLRVTGRADTWVPEIVIDFGDVPLVDGKTGWLEVDVPPHAISLSVEALAGTDPTFPYLSDLEGPGGYAYVNDQGTSPLVWKVYQGSIFALTIPNTDRPDAQLVPGGGRYRLRFAYNGPTVKARAIVENRPDAVIDGGVLDLNLFFAPGLNVTDPANDPKVAAVLQGAEQILGKIGLRFGEVSYFQLADAAYNTVDSIDELGALGAQSSVAPSARLNLFFVQVLFPNQFGQSLGGVTTAVPGPKRNGTVASGVAVSYPYNASLVGIAVAHETCHLLGLLHTTEPDGQHDDIEDTLKCPVMGADSVCTTQGAGYLMFWNPVSDVITPGQARVILGHPLVGPAPASLSALAQQAPAAPELFDLPPGFCGTCARK